MKKLLILLVILISLSFYKLNYDKFIVEKTNIVYRVRLKENSKMKKMENYISNKIFSKNQKLKKLAKELESTRNYVNAFTMVHFGKLDAKKDTDMVLIVDPGFSYPIFKIRMNKYLVKKGKYYRFKDKYSNSFKKYTDLKKYTDMRIYPYRGNFLFACKEATLEKYLTLLSEKKYNENLITEMKNYSYTTFGNGTVDLSFAKNRPELFKGYKYLDFSGDFIKGDVYLDLNLKGKTKLNDWLKVDLKSRNYTKYLTEDMVYLSSDDFSSYENIIMKTLPPKVRKKVKLAEKIFRFSIKDILKTLDKEILIDLENEKALIPFKDLSALKNILVKFGIKEGKKYTVYPDISVLLEGNNLYINDKFKVQNKIDLNENDFFFIKVDLNKLIEEEVPKTLVRINGQAKEDSLRLRFKMTEKKLDESKLMDAKKTGGKK